MPGSRWVCVTVSAMTSLKSLLLTVLHAELLPDPFSDKREWEVECGYAAELLVDAQPRPGNENDGGGLRNGFLDFIDWVSGTCTKVSLPTADPRCSYRSKGLTMGFSWVKFRPMSVSNETPSRRAEAARAGRDLQLLLRR
ncbi:hypothetical protein BDZ91DRAFT_751702 [Kalaharituber pfeilii]|nr:hypothetical protein BDZ91DRAFT_751702 [Kalaharituber pfeilii]